MTKSIPKNAVVLFQGDSITDHGRNRDDGFDLGAGYPMIASAWFSMRYPQKRASFFNRGIGGDRVKDLLNRWEADCIALTPTWVSILVGVNNTWRRFDANDPTPVEVFARDYHDLLQTTRERLNPQFILCEPFLLPVREEHQYFREDLEPKIEVVRRLAREFDAILVPLDTIFWKAAEQREAAFWLYDGIHPTPAGAALIAHSWLNAVHAL